MKNTILLIAVLFLSFTAYSNEKYDKVLIKEYYNLLETQGTTFDTYSMAQWDISYDVYNRIYRHVESVHVGEIVTEGINNYSTTIFIKNYYDDKPSFYKVNILTEELEDGLKGIKSIESTHTENPYSKKQLKIIKYYEYMERTTTLDDAYKLFKKSYSLEKFKSWYNYNRAYIDLKFVSTKTDKISIIVNFSEDYLGRRELFKYSVDFTYKYGKVINSESSRIDVDTPEYQLRFIDNRLVCGNIMSTTEVDSFLKSLKGSIGYKELFKFYRYCYTPELVHDFIAEYMKKGYGYDSRSFVFTYKSYTDNYTSNIGMLKLLIDSGMSVNARAWEPGMVEMFPINLAVQTGNIYLINYVLSKGVEKSTNALYDSLKMNRLDIFEILLKNDISINQSHIQSSEGHSYYSNSLFYAIYNNDIGLIVYLINKGIDLNAKHTISSGWDITMLNSEFNPTGLALYYGREDILKLLLLYGADEPEGHRNKLYYTPFQDGELTFPNVKGTGNYYAWDVKPNLDTKIYSKNGKFYKHTIVTDAYTAAELSNRDDVIKLFDDNNIKPDKIDKVEEFIID